MIRAQRASLKEIAARDAAAKAKMAVAEEREHGEVPLEEAGLVRLSLVVNRGVE